MRQRSAHLRLAEWNAGNGTPDDLRNIIAETPDVLIGVEWGDRHRDLTPVLAHAGYRVLLGNLPGSKSTVVFYGPGVKFHRALTWLLLARQWIGPGAGPDHNKPKVLNGGRLSLDGIPFGAAAEHAVASQQNAPREHAAEEQFARTVRLLDGRRIPWFVGMDANATPDKRQLGVFWSHEWTSNHREGGTLATRMGRAIDTFVWKDTPRVTFVRHWKLATHSDHDALFVEVVIRRRHWRR